MGGNPLLLELLHQLKKQIAVCGYQWYDWYLVKILLKNEYQTFIKRIIDRRRPENLKNSVHTFMYNDLNIKHLVNI